MVLTRGVARGGGLMGLQPPPPRNFSCSHTPPTSGVTRVVGFIGLQPDYHLFNYLSFSDPQNVSRSKFDIGLYTDGSKVDDDTKHQLLASPWIPPPCYMFKSMNDFKQKRRFTWLGWTGTDGLATQRFKRVRFAECVSFLAEVRLARANMRALRPSYPSHFKSGSTPSKSSVHMKSLNITLTLIW